MDYEVKLNLQFLIFGIVAANFLLLMDKPISAYKTVAITFFGWFVIQFVVPTAHSVWNWVFKIKEKD